MGAELSGRKRMAMVLIAIGSLAGLVCGAAWGLFAGFSVVGVLGGVLLGAMIGGLLGLVLVVARFAKGETEGDTHVSQKTETSKMTQGVLRS